MRSEAIRVAFRNQKSLDQALADAEQSAIIVQRNPEDAERVRRRSMSRKGGSVPKTDALQMLIQVCVREAPEINRRKLWHRLRQELGRGTITAIDAQRIEFRTSNGKFKISPVSGLKDRLSRAKRKGDSL